MNATTTLPSREKSRSEAVLRNGKLVKKKVSHVPVKDSAEAHSRLILSTIVAFREGNFSVRLPADWTGVDAQIAEAFNQTIAQKERIVHEVTRLSATVGKEGRLKQRMSLPGAVGAWASEVECINTLIDDLVRPTTEIARTIGAVAKGDLDRSMDLEVDGRLLKGEFLRSAKRVNTMIDQLSVFTSEVTRVAREVGTEGKLGSQARVKGVSGVWKELTDSVNQMAGNLSADDSILKAVSLGLEKQRLRLQYAEAQQDLRLLNQGLERRIVERTAELEIANSRLARELSERKQIEERLLQLTGTLEERVMERTQQLSTSYGRLRALATELTVAEQTERRRLARELHDYLAQILVVARMKVGQLLTQNHDQEVQKTLQDVDQLLHQSLNYTRSLVSELTPQALYESGLDAAIRWLGDQMRRQAVLDVEFELDAPELRLPEGDAILLFHSVRELLFNVLKHGKVNCASVSMQHAQDMLSITVSDHGCGFDVSNLSDDHSNRFGLLSIRERMAALGGSFDLQSEPGKGTVASLHLPCTSLDVGTEAPADEGEGSAASEGAVCGGHCHPNVSVDNLSDGKASSAVRILIVDDHQLVREGLHCLLNKYDDLTVIGEASTGHEALRLVGTHMPDVVIMDMQMPGWNGAETTRRILAQYPFITVIGLSVQTDPHIGQSMLEAGAAVFLPKEAINTDLYDAILRALGRSTSPKPHASPSPA